MPLKIVENLSHWRGKDKNSSKYQRPHCIVPIADFQWVTNQTKTVQKLWGECWSADPYGSRWVKINTSLSDRSFREAKKRLYAEGMFEFKPNPSTIDGRLTEGWLVKNLHGARRINDYWKQPDDVESYQEESQEIGGENLPDDGRNLPDNGEKIPINGENLPPIPPETIENTRVPEPLSNISETPQEHLKGVPEVEEIAMVSPLKGDIRCNEELITKLHRQIESTRNDANLTKFNRNRKIAMLTRMIQRISGVEITHKDFLKQTLTYDYKFSVDEDRLNRVLSLTNYQSARFLERIKLIFRDKGYVLKNVFDEVLLWVKNNISDQMPQPVYDL